AWFVMIVLIGAPRLIYRAFKDGGLVHLRPRDRSGPDVERLLIVGNAAESDAVIRTYGLEHSRRYKVCGIVDYKAAELGRVLRGAPRLIYRAFQVGGLAHLRPRDRSGPDVERLLIVGNAAESDAVIRTYGLEHSRRYKVCGIVDYKATELGRDVRGIPIIGEI